MKKNQIKKVTDDTEKNDFNKKKNHSEEMS